MGEATLYLLIVCVGDYCYAPLGPMPSLTRQDCLEHLHLIHFSAPEKPVICRTYKQTDVIDSDGKLLPRSGWDEVR